MQEKLSKSALLNFHFIGLLLSVKFLFSAQKFSILAFLALVASIYIIFEMYRIAIRFREIECDGYISYSKAFYYLFLIYIFGALVSSLVILIYTQFINKDFLDLSLSTLMKMYESMKIHIDNQTYTLIEKIFKPLPYSLFNLFVSLITATFWSLILATFVKKEKTIF